MNIERRKSPRTQPEKLTYIHLQSGNGAIILNFSEDGFCFRSAGPILETGPVRFTFSLQSGQQPQAIGELVWTDKARKKGGLRFTDFPADARNPLNVRFHRLPIQRIETMHLDGISSPQESVAEVPPHEKPASHNAPTAEQTASLAPAAAEPVAPKTPSRAIVRIAGKTEISNHRPRIAWDAPRDWPNINWGTVVGFAVFIIFAVVLVHAYADRLGQSSPYGEATPGNLSPAKQQSAIPASDTSDTSDNSSPLQELRAQIAALQSEDGDGVRGRSTTAGRGSAKSDASNDDPAPAPAANAPDNTSDAAKSDIPEQSTHTDGDTAKSAPDADAVAGDGAASADATKLEEADGGAPASTTYYDIGNFKDLARADQAADDLGKLGFRAIVVHKTLLWMGSFHVVVGPFSSDQDSEAARSRLGTLGFSPRLAKSH